MDLAAEEGQVAEEGEGAVPGWVEEAALNPRERSPAAAELATQSTKAPESEEGSCLLVVATTDELIVVQSKPNLQSFRR